tara:strand:- start:125 stop:793 length:669 start_codon:yes stop_codon:yes gene_type:complete
MRALRSLLATLVILAFGATTGVAEVAKQIDWQSLVPAAKPLENPLKHLEWEQQAEIEFLATIRELHAQGAISKVDYRYEEGLEIAYKLEKKGLDVDGLVAKFQVVQREIVRRNNAVVTALDGKMIRMPGYALPLEFDGTAVSEFLLVPYVGACIHVPAPPANQTVFVTLNQSYKANNLYDPVWITGRLKVKTTNKSLSYVDGSAVVESGYTLEGVKIEPYKQ